jgi:tight adherence protein B
VTLLLATSALALAGAVALCAAAPASAARLRAAAVREDLGPRLGCCAAWSTWRGRARLGARRRQALARSSAVLELVDGMAAELRAGRLPAAALAAAAEEGPIDLALPGAGPVDDADVLERLEAAAGAPGAQGLRQVALCWRVAASSGAGLARALEQVAAGLRHEQAVAREVAGQLAAPRATARLLAVLPVFGWLLGSALGADPLQVLVTTGYGWACLLLGVPLQVAGWWWIEHGAAALDPARYRGGR